MSDLELDLDVVRETRALHPERIAELAASRVRRPLLRGNNRLMLVAADHPARGALGVRGVATAMENRTELMTRLVRAIRRPGVDGVLGSPDILEDLLLLGELDDKLVFGSMNRGGLQGASFELDDRFTAYDVPTLLRLGLDGGKMLTRIDLSDPGTARTLEHCGAAVSALAAAGLPAMIEPFMSFRQGDRIVNDLTAAAVAKSVGIASALGATSAYTWLKVPVVDGMERVMAATTLPTLLLGGDPSTSPDEIYASWADALALPGVRGLVVGRALLFPPDEDVEAAVDSAVSLVAGNR
jgi:DhnA family fructose-bisphosphate aldolase class Ia